MIAAIEAALQHDVAGDPITGIRWTRRTTEKIARELATLDIQVCPRTVARILKDLDYRLRVNHKRVAAGSGPDRDQQFQYLAEQRMKFAQRGLPIVSIDTKKRELVGNFKNQGTTWERSPQAVNDHDFRSQADGIAIPYGVYDVGANRGFVVVGTCHDTPDFAADNLVRWWHSDGLERYRNASELLVLADSGGSNAPRVRCFKYALQTRLVDPYQLTVTVCHYPSGASKWNPIDHRLFSEISKNWAARPLRSYQTILNHIRTTTTDTGLCVTASWSTRNTRRASKSPTLSSLPSPLNLIRSNRYATTRSVHGPELRSKSALILAPSLRSQSLSSMEYQRSLIVFGSEFRTSAHAVPFIRPDRRVYAASSLKLSGSAGRGIDVGETWDFHLVEVGACRPRFHSLVGRRPCGHQPSYQERDSLDGLSMLSAHLDPQFIVHSCDMSGQGSRASLLPPRILKRFRFDTYSTPLFSCRGRHLIAHDCERIRYYHEIVDYEQRGATLVDLFEWNARSIPRQGLPGWVPAPLDLPGKQGFAAGRAGSARCGRRAPTGQLGRNARADPQVERRVVDNRRSLAAERPEGGVQIRSREVFGYDEV